MQKRCCTTNKALKVPESLGAQGERLSDTLGGGMSDKKGPKVPESLGAQGERLSDTLGRVCLTKGGQKCRKALGLKGKGCQTLFEGFV